MKYIGRLFSRNHLSFFTVNYRKITEIYVLEVYGIILFFNKLHFDTKFIEISGLGALNWSAVKKVNF